MGIKLLADEAIEMMGSVDSSTSLHDTLSYLPASVSAMCTMGFRSVHEAAFFCFGLFLLREAVR